MMGERSRSFGSAAAHYDTYRPGPTPEVIDWVIPGGCTIAVDIGAGTGALTKLIAPRVATVYAVEPDARMAEVLTRNVPGVNHLLASAEQIPLPDATAQLVAGASMWHWVDPVVATREVARVLEPGGTFALLGAGVDRSVDWVAEVLAHDRPEAMAASPQDADRRWVDRTVLPGGSPFTEPEFRLFRWTIRVDHDFLVELACTYSGFLVLSEHDKVTARNEVRRIVAGHPLLGGSGQIELPMRCFVVRRRRL